MFTNARALLVGVTNYVHRDTFPPGPPIRYAHDDARLVRDALLLVGYPRDRLRILVDQQATKQNIEYELDWLDRQLRPEDLVLFFFSGHGSIGSTLMDKDVAYLVPHDGRMGNASVGIPLGVLADSLVRLKCRNKVMFLDACFSGGFLHSNHRFFDALRRGSGNLTIVASCCRNELSFEHPVRRRGAFTHALIEGLCGMFPGANEGAGVSVTAVVDHLTRAVPAEADFLGQSQYPSFVMMGSNECATIGRVVF